MPIGYGLLFAYIVGKFICVPAEISTVSNAKPPALNAYVPILFAVQVTSEGCIPPPPPPPPVALSFPSASIVRLLPTFTSPSSVAEATGLPCTPFHCTLFAVFAAVAVSADSALSIVPDLVRNPESFVSWDVLDGISDFSARSGLPCTPFHCTLFAVFAAVAVVADVAEIAWSIVSVLVRNPESFVSWDVFAGIDFLISSSAFLRAVASSCTFASVSVFV